STPGQAFPYCADCLPSADGSDRKRDKIRSGSGLIKPPARIDPAERMDSIKWRGSNKMHSRAVSVAPAAYDFSADSFSQNIPQFERFLGELKHTPCRLLEIGAHEGRSATWLIDNIATHPSATVDTIDAYEKPRLQHNLAATGHREKVTFHA